MYRMLAGSQVRLVSLCEIALRTPLPDTGHLPQPYPSAVASPIRLSDLSAGQVVRLHGSDLAPQDCAMLRALGMTDHCLLRICKVGESCIVEVRSTRIGLSRSVADGIFVVPETVG